MRRIKIAGALLCSIVFVLSTRSWVLAQSSSSGGNGAGGVSAAGNSGSGGGSSNGGSSGGDSTGAATSGGGSKGSGSSGGQSTKGGSGTGGSGSGGTTTSPFESQMLAYGAVDQIALAIAKGVCAQVKGKNATIIVYDSASFSSIQAYGGFEANVGVLLAAYSGIKSGLTGAEAAPGVLDVASLILQYAGASTVENASSITLSDDAIKMNIVHHINASNNKAGCNRSMVSILYPPVAMQLSASKGALNDIATKLVNLARAKNSVASIIASTKRDPSDPLVLQFQDTNKAYDQFFSSLYSKDPNTGQAGMVSILNGHDLYNLVHAAGTYILFEEAIAGGGTQRIRKNLFTNVFWGDLIRYSGGAVVSFALVDGPTSSIMTANTLRFRTPNTSLAKSDQTKVSDAEAGDNLSAID